MRTFVLLALAATVAASTPGFAAAAPAAAAVSGLPMTPARRIAFDTDEGTWMSPALSPDGRTIAFDILGRLYLVDAAGGRARTLSSGMAFESQPVFSPDGRWIAFLSDRSGAENLWIMRPDGTGARQVTKNEGPDEYVSPAWAPDGKSLYVSLYRSDRNAIELWREPLDGGNAKELTGGKFSALGAAVSPDGRFVYVAERSGPVFEDDVELPLWSIHRLSLKDDRDETVVTNVGSAMRPALSPDGRTLVYTARFRGETELRARDLDTGHDRRLVWPVQRDVQEALPTRDLTPSVSFTPDGAALVTSFGGKLQRVSLATGAHSVIPVQAHVDLELGAFERQKLVQATGPVRARLDQDPVLSPDGRRLAFSALGRIYVMELNGGRPKRLTVGGPPEFMPAWSPDGKRLAYVTWTSQEGGEVWTAAADGASPPRRVDASSAYYTHPAFSPDGRSILALRSSAFDRLHTYQEPAFTGRSYGQLRQAELVELPAAGGAARVITSGEMSGEPQFVAADPDHAYLNTDKGLEVVGLRDGARRLALSVTGPGYYFIDGSVAADDLKISPDGRLALAQLAQQLYLVRVPQGHGEPKPIDVEKPGPDHRRLTAVGADFFGWADGGRTISWALGDTVFRRPVAGVELGGEALRPEAGRDGVQAIRAEVDLPRDQVRGALVLRGATVVTMRGKEVIPDADVVVVDGRIAAVAPRGRAPIPAGAQVRDVSGKFITPGLIDVHDHFGSIRRGVLEFDDWSMAATLAWGVTTALDPSTLSVDMLAYEDALQTGQTLGPRLYSTATAIFSYTRLKSLEDARDIVSRYVDYYGTRNLKEYRVGSRRQRQWLAMAAVERNAMATTEGAVDMKLDLTQIIDGYSGNEHTLSAAPLYRDVLELLARSRVSYDLTLEISHGGPPAGEIFTARTAPREDPKVMAFYPEFAATNRFDRAHWADPLDRFYPKAAAAAAAAQRAGAVIGMGSHGNYPGIGYAWELEAMASGGMTPFEVLKAATLGSAETIGRIGELGSLEPGKFADLIILDRDPLADVANVQSIRQVMKGGRLYDAGTLDELWPVARPRPRPWFRDEETGRP
jgi:Tol biopolymer transport system component